VELITQTILNLRNEFIINDIVNNYKEINSGYCPEFAEEVSSIVNNDNVYEISIESFMQDQEWNGDGNDKWCHESLEEYNINIPYNLSIDDINKIVFPYHVWITDGIKHYDAECPEGVENIFDLPIFKAYLK